MRTSAFAVGALLLAGGALTWIGKPEREVSLTSVGELWADVFRDADSFGLQLSRVSARDEMDLGRNIATRLMQSNATSPAWQTYVNQVGQSLVRHAHRKDIAYEFHVIDAPVLNAFALPGGQIFIYTGLLDKMSSEAELAAVLGHEIAHVDARHSIERFQYQIRLKNLGLGDLGSLVNLTRILLSQGYAQYQELEADSEGLRTALAENYDPRGNIDLFARIFQSSGLIHNSQTPLEEMARLAGSVFTDYFQSHPPTPERLRRLTAQIKKFAGLRVYRGVENLRRRIPKSQKQYPNEYTRI